MSTKTTFKRIALVTVAALGFGMLSVAPSSATESDLTEVGGITATTNGLRAGILTAVYLKALPTDTSDTSETIVINSIISGRPAGSAIALNDTTTVTQSAASVAFTGTGTAAISSTVEHTFTPDVAGTYTMISWHDADSDSVRDAGEKSLTISLVVVPQTDAITATTAVSYSTVAAGGAYGAAVTVTIKNSNGAVTRLGSFEQLAVAASSSGSVFAGSDANGVQTPYAASGSAVTGLVQSNFTKGVAYLNVTKAAAGTSVLTVTGEAGAASAAVNTSNSITFKDVSDVQATSVDSALAVDNDADGADASTTYAYVKKSTASTVDFVATLDAGDAQYVADSYASVRIADTSGYFLGAAGFKQDRAYLADADELAFSIGVNLPASAAVKVTLDTGSADGEFDITGQTAAGTTLTNTSDYFRVLNGGSTTMTATLKDQFGNKMANEAVTITVTGRNSKSASGLTDANGVVTYTLADAAGATSVLTSDSVVLDGPGSGDSDTVTITYGATIGVSTMTLTGGNTTAGVTATTATVREINAGIDGPSATTWGFSATLKDANGSVLTGVPVTWTISGTGAAVLSTHVTTYTIGTGVASTLVYGWVAGTYTVTATADGKTATGTITFGQAAAGEERAISAKSDGSVVTATVVDRFGNPVPGVTVYATKTGAGYFGSGVTKTSAVTSADGTAEFVISGGAATVTVSTISYSAVAGTYGSGQTSAPKGYVANAATAAALALNAFTAYTAGTTTVAEDGVGASFDAAGVSSASAEAGSDSAGAAADAAAEATDAANAATDAANAAAEAADAATAAAQDAADAVAALSTQVSEMVNALKKQITALTNLVIKIQKKVKA